VTETSTLSPDTGVIPPEITVLTEAIQGVYGDDPQRIAVVALEWVETLMNKNRDYGSSIWETPLLAPNTDCGDAILIRMSDKISRLQNLLRGGEVTVKDESIEDTMKDLGAYALLWLARPAVVAGNNQKPT
jgi:hypothetical protein